MCIHRAVAAGMQKPAARSRGRLQIAFNRVALQTDFVCQRSRSLRSQPALRPATAACILACCLRPRTGLRLRRTTCRSRDVVQPSHASWLPLRCAARPDSRLAEGAASGSALPVPRATASRAAALPFGRSVGARPSLVPRGSVSASPLQDRYVRRPLPLSATLAGSLLMRRRALSTACKQACTACLASSEAATRRGASSGAGRLRLLRNRGKLAAAVD